MKSLKECLTQFPPIKIKSHIKEEVLSELVSYLLIKNPEIQNHSAILEEFLKREKLCTTGLGLGMAFPHIRSQVVTEIKLCIGWSQRGIAFDSVDQLPVHIIFLFIIPDAAKNEYLKTVSEIIKEMRGNEYQLLMENESPLSEFKKLALQSDAESIKNN